MTNKKLTPAEYRERYKQLRRYYVFSFPLPHYKKDFTPQQKSSITRKFEKIAPYINDDYSPKIKEISFLKYPPHSTLPHVDGIRTDVGLFYKWPQASLKKSKLDKNKWLIVVNPTISKLGKMVQKRRDIFIPFPKSIIGHPYKIEIFVDKVREKYRPHGIQWSLENSRPRSIFDIEKLNLYISGGDENQFDMMRELAERAIKKYKNIFSTDPKKRDAVTAKIKKADWYLFLDDIERLDFWAALNFMKSARREGVYNGIFLVYYL